VTLQFQSSYHQLETFLGQIERAPLFLLIEQLELSATPVEQIEREPLELSASTRQGTQADVQLTLSTLYVPPVNPALSRKGGVKAEPGT